MLSVQQYARQGPPPHYPSPPPPSSPAADADTQEFPKQDAVDEMLDCLEHMPHLAVVMTR